MTPLDYISTRGQAPVLGFEDVLLTGLARDGGLYVPDHWPEAAGDFAEFADLPYRTLAAKILQPFVAGAFDEDALGALCDATYRLGVFDDERITPLRPIGENLWLLELFHGPTLAFKDIALQLLGRMFDSALEKRGDWLTIIGATSGDTGSAAIEACRDRDNLSIFMLHPKGRVSEVQRRLMTTVDSPNVFNIGIDGTFDDCQALVKALFGDLSFRDQMHLSAVNSINWARIMAQIVYYFHAALKLGAPETPVSFSVPTGNFGDVYAGYAAARMGLPVRRLIVATNENDILYRALTAGDYSRLNVTPTTSPAMDIQVASNFERLLFDLYGRDGDAIREKMDRFAQTGTLTIAQDQLSKANAIFDAARVSESDVPATIDTVFRRHGVVLDPHTAVGVAAARKLGAGESGPCVVMGTAHPAKFPDVVEKTIGERPRLPGRLADLFERPERCETLPADLAAVQAFIRDKAPSRG